MNKMPEITELRAALKAKDSEITHMQDAVKAARECLEPSAGKEKKDRLRKALNELDDKQ